MSNNQEHKRIYHYQIDTEGRLWHEGSEIKDVQVLKFFHRKMEKLEQGKIQVLCMGEVNYIEAQDVPYVVQAVNIMPDQIQLTFPGNYQEILDPTSLQVGKDNVLYCRVRNGEFLGRFNRKSYLEITKQMDYNPKDGYFLKLAGRHFQVLGVADQI